MLAGEPGRDTREIFEAIGTRDDVDHRGLLDRLAGVEGLHVRQLGVVGAKQIGGAPQYAPALRAGHRRPHPLALVRGFHRALHFGGTGNLDLGEDLAGRRVDAGEGLGGEAVDIGPADVVAEAG